MKKLLIYISVLSCLSTFASDSVFSKSDIRVSPGTDEDPIILITITGEAAKDLYKSLKIPGLLVGNGSTSSSIRSKDGKHVSCTKMSGDINDLRCYIEFDSRTGKAKRY